MDNGKMQQERLKRILERLKDRGFSQKNVADSTETEEPYLSRLKSGAKKEIPPEFISKLEEVYNINPYYISGESEIMFLPHIDGLKQLDQIVEKWDTVEKSQNKYLHLYMDRNLYDFLIEVNTVRLVAAEGISSEDTEIRNLAKLYFGEPEIQEFVLLPKNILIEILESAKEDKNKLEEVIDFWEYTDYVEDDSGS